MMRDAAATALLVCGLAVGLRAQGAPLPSDPARRATWVEVQALNDSMMTAFNRGDFARVALFYADTAVIQGTNGAPVKGRAAIDRYWKGIQNPKRWVLEVLSVGGSRDLAYQFGRSRLITTDAAGAERTSVVDFVVIWQRGPDGTLRIAFDLYSW